MKSHVEKGAEVKAHFFELFHKHKKGPALHIERKTDAPNPSNHKNISFPGE